MNTKNFIKKYLVGVVSVLAMCAMLIIPCVSFADGFTGDGSGTAEDPFIITNCTELQEMNLDVSSHFKLEGVEDTIDCSSTSTLNDNGEGGFYGFAPVQNFTGELDGNDNTITNLYINRPGDGATGLFADIENGANIHDVSLTGVNITGGSNVGVIVGNMYDSSNISNVTISGAVVGNNNDVGGLVGYYDAEQAETGTISNITSSVDVTDDNYYIGGLIGYVYESDNANLNISDLSLSGSVIAAGSYDGGIIGYASVNNSSELSITDSSVGLDGGTTNGSSQVGGAIGYADIESADASITLTNVTSNFTIDPAGTIPNGEIGGMVGEVYEVLGGTITINGGSHVTLSTPETTSSMGDFGGVIGFVNNDDFWLSMGTVTIDNTSVDGNINSNLSDIGGFIGYIDARDSTISITSGSTNIADIHGDLNIGGVIGEYYMYYSSTINITDVTVGGDEATGVHAIDGSVGGLIGFGSAYHGAMLNITGVTTGLSNTQLTSDGDSYIGGFAGDLEQRYGSDVTIDNSISNVGIDGDYMQYVGGMIGYSVIRYNSTLTITDGSYTDGAIDSGAEAGTFSVGGLIGELDSRTSNLNINGGSFSSVDISVLAGGSSASSTGGFVGYLYSQGEPLTVTIDNAHNDGSISAGVGDGFGGFIGYATGDSDNAGTISITDSYNSGTLTFDESDAYDIGGLLGEIYDFDISIDGGSSTQGITGDNTIGGLLGYAEVYNGANVSIINSSWANESPITITAVDGYAGGLIGQLYMTTKTSLTVDSSHAVGTISSDSTNGVSLGGLVGSVYADPDSSVGDDVTVSVTGSYSTVDIPFGEAGIGGIFGEITTENGVLNASITDSSSSGTIGNVDDLTQISEGGAGGLVGEQYRSCCGDSTIALTINRSSSSSDISSTTGYTGGLIGFIDDGTTASISHSNASGNITADTNIDPNNGYAVGGLVGDTDGGITVDTSFATGNVTGTDYIGGLLGDTDGIISVTNSYATGNVTGNYEIGGLIGYIDSATVTNTYASGDVSSIFVGDDVEEGGLIGFGGYDSILSNNFAAGAVSSATPDATALAGLVGDYADTTTLSNNFYDAPRSGQVHCSYYEGEGQTPNDSVGECEGVDAPVDTGANYFFGDVTDNHPFDNGPWDFDTIWKTNTAAYPTLLQTYHITASAEVHGSISPSGVASVAEGQDQEFTFTPDEGYEVADVVVDDVAVDTADTYTFSNVSADHTISVGFISTDEVPTTYTLTKTTAGAGTGSIVNTPTGSTFDAGTEVTLTAAAAVKSTFKGWSGCSSAETTSITITMSSNKTCTATFNKASSGSTGGGGGGSPSKLYVPPSTVPPANSPSDCTGGALFSASTGAKCGSSKTNIPGCEAGFLFSPSTGQSCAGSSQTNNTNVNNNTNNTPSSNTCSLTLNLKIGDTGTQVKCLQTILGITSDGIFGKGTKAAVVAFQKSHGLDTDGVVGPKTRGELSK